MQIIRSTLIVSITTFVSRLLGYLRDAFIAAVLGATPLNDVFLVAFRLANLFRSLFGEGAFHSAFIPIFSGLTKRKNLIYAKIFAMRVQSILLCALMVFCAIVMIFMPYVIKVTTPGILSRNPEYFLVMVELSRITFPYLLLISLVAFYGGMLNSIGKFFPFASISIWFNLILIFFLLYGDFFSTKVHALCYGLIIAGIVELLWILYFAKTNNLLIPIQKPKINSRIKTMLMRLTAGIFGAGILQINTWVDLVFASLIPGGISFLYFADRIMQFPLAIIGTASSFVLLPTLAKHFSNNDIKEANETQNTIIKFTMFFAIPASFGLIYIAKDIVEILFKHGNFDENDVANTASALKCFALGLPAFILNKIFVSYFHSRGDMKTPLSLGVFGMLLNICLSAILIFPFQHAGIALASSITASINTFIVICLCRSKNLYTIDKHSAYICLQSIFAASCMLTFLLNIPENYLFHVKFINVLLYAVLGLISYLMIFFAVHRVRCYIKQR